MTTPVERELWGERDCRKADAIAVRPVEDWPVELRKQIEIPLALLQINRRLDTPSKGNR